MKKLEDALAAAGLDDHVRQKVIRLCHDIEAKLARPDFDVRENVTGPIIDALHRDLGLLQKRLRNGLVFHFRYSGRIARDFVMSVDEEPDHVWEPQTTKLLLHLAREASTVVIGGAYAGDQALLVANELKSKGGACHCFEPDLEQVTILEQNALANGLEGNMIVNAAALWDTDDARLLLVGQGELGTPKSANGAASTSIAATTLDSYGTSNGLSQIDLLMLDVEGGEEAILRGATRYLSQPLGRAPNIVFEIHRLYTDWSSGLENTSVGSMLLRHGYRLFAIRDYQSNVPMDGPIELVDCASAYLEGPPHGFNMLAVKDEEIVRRPPFVIRSGVSPKLLRHRDPRLHQPLSGDS